MATLTLDEETRLIEAAIAGDQSAFEAIYTAYANIARRAVMYLVTDDQIDDMVQETFLRVHRNLASFKRDARLSTWIHRIAVNQALQYLRSKANIQDRRTQSLDETYEDAEAFVIPVIDPGIEDRTIATNEVRTIVHAAMVKLKPGQRELISLILEGYGPTDVVAWTGQPMAKVKARFYRARHALKAVIEGSKVPGRPMDRRRRVSARPSQVFEPNTKQIDARVQAILSAKQLSVDEEMAVCA